MIEWNPSVNNDFSLDGEFSHEDNFTQTIKFESGKERIWLKNSYIPVVFPSLSLTLDNKTQLDSGKTEFAEFLQWYEVSLRYGILPFCAPRIGYKIRSDVETGEMGIYTFIPESLNFDRLDGISLASFGLKEIGVLPEKTYIFLVTNNGEILLTQNGQHIII